MGKGKRDDIHSAEVKCNLKEKGALLTEVMTFRSGRKKPKSGLEKVKAKASGPTKVGDKVTGAKGRTAVCGGLDPGNYTVTLEFPDDMKELYDVDGSTTSDTKEVKKRKTQTYYFEVPWFWLDHEVKYPDNKTFAQDIAYVLRHKKPAPPDAAWTQHSKGKTANKKVELDKVPRGLYRLELKLVYDPAWGGREVVIDRDIELTAAVSGFDPGADGAFEIRDAHTPSTLLHKLDVKVAEDSAKTKREIKTTWRPAKAQLKDLKSGKVVFRAVVSDAFAFSEPVTVFTKEKYEVVDQDGKKLDTVVELRFSGGHIETKAAVGGEMEVLFPWNEAVARIDTPGHKGKHISLDEGGIPARRFLMPQ